MLKPQIGKLRLKTLQLLSLAEELGSLRAVADAVHTSQPAVTQAIQEIEQVFGTPLLERSVSGVLLTPAGEILLQRFRVVLQEMNAAQASLNAPVRPLLRLGLLPFMMMNDLIPSVLRDWPEPPLPFRLQLHENTAPGLRQRLLTGADDLVLTRLSASALEPSDMRSMRVTPMQQDGLMVFARARHPVLRGTAPAHAWQLAQLLAYDWVLPHTTTQLRLTVNDMFISTHQAPPQPLVEAGSLFGLVSLVAASDLIGIAPGSAVLKFARLFKLRPLRIKNLASPSMQVVAIHHRRQDGNAALQMFLTQLKCAVLATQAPH